MLIIGLAGAAGSGKDTVADHLCSVSGSARAAFADHLKRVCADVFGWDLDRLRDQDYKAEPGTPDPDGATRRRILQLVGTDCFRAIHPNVWVDSLMRSVDARTVGVVITDVRFQNEVDAILERDGVVLRLDCPDHPTRLEGAGASHASESAVAQLRGVHADLVVPYGHIRELQQRAEAYVRYLAACPDEAAAFLLDFAQTPGSETPEGTDLLAAITLRAGLASEAETEARRFAEQDAAAARKFAEAPGGDDG